MKQLYMMLLKSWGVDPKAEMYKLPAIYVGAYAEKDAQITLDLWQELKKEITHQDLGAIFKMETDLFPCLVDMRFLGVRVDSENAHKLKTKLVGEEKQLLITSKKRNRNRCSNMGCKIDCQSF